MMRHRGNYVSKIKTVEKELHFPMNYVTFAGLKKISCECFCVNTEHNDQCTFNVTRFRIQGPYLSSL